MLISGADVAIDVNDLRAHTQYAGGYGDEHECIELFWKVVGTMTDEQKRLLLKFVTSCSRPPLLGFKVGSMTKYVHDCQFDCSIRVVCLLV